MTAKTKVPISKRIAMTAIKHVNNIRTAPDHNLTKYRQSLCRLLKDLSIRSNLRQLID